MKIWYTLYADFLFSEHRRRDALATPITEKLRISIFFHDNFVHNIPVRHAIHLCKWWTLLLLKVTVALSANCDYTQLEIRNVLTTIHSFSSRQWMTQRQCVYELSQWQNTQLICVKCIKNSWMTISSVKITYPTECNCHLLYRITSESYLMSSLPLLRVYINQCKFHMFISFQDHHSLVQHVLPRTTSSSMYEINY